MVIGWVQDSVTVLFPQNKLREQTNLRMFMGATPSQVLVLGLNRSTEFRQLVPSLPPATYSMPSSTATPALLRRLSILAMAVHVLLCSWTHNASYTVAQIHPQTPDLGPPGNKLIALMMNWSSAQFTWGSYFSTVARCEELSYPPTAYRLPSGMIKSKQSESKY